MHGVRFGAIDAGYLLGRKSVKALANRDTALSSDSVGSGRRRRQPIGSPPGGSGWCFTSLASDGLQAGSTRQGR